MTSLRGQATCSARVTATWLVIVAAELILSSGNALASVPRMTATEGAAHWAIVSSPNKGNQSSLISVTCPAVNDCWAVGSHDNHLQGEARTLIEHYTGSGWVIVSSPTDGSRQANLLSGVTCTSTRNCWAVGSYSTTSSSYTPHTLIEHYNGHGWRVVSTPNVGNYSSLSAVTCVGAKDCWAVGAGGTGNALIEHYTGSSWGIVSSPSLSNEGTYLSSVTCNKVRDCWAVGTYSSGHLQTLIEHYSDSGWAIVGSPSPSEQNELASISCSNSSSCWAVGGYEPGAVGGADSLIEHYTGGAWVHVSSPNPGNLTGLGGVACAEPLDCWAVGATTNFIGNSQAFIVRDSGSGWAVDSSPDPGTAGSSLNSVTCVSSRNCWAVGESFDGMVVKTLIEHYSRAVAPPLP